MTTTSDTHPSAAHQLDTSGYAIVRTAPSGEALMTAAHSLGRAIGARTLGYVHLHAADRPEWLGRHTECLTDSTTPLRYFALGCIRPATEGGQTLLYDGSHAAAILIRQLPDAAHVRISYHSAHRPESCDHPLIADHEKYGRVLRYRSACENNTITAAPTGLTETQLYAQAEAALTASLTYTHWWSPGDVLIVDNHRLIHSRAPFTGHRHMLRVRYDDPIHQAVTLAQ